MLPGKLWFAMLAIPILGMAGLVLTRPETVAPQELAGITGDADRGERLFNLGGCASCHLAPGDKNPEKRVLAGGKSFPSPFGVFFAPNISSSKAFGIGNWSDLDLVNAMHFGTSPQGEHYYPAFPYTSYARAEFQDIVDIRAFLNTLPASETPSKPHQVPFPFNIRASLGGWKMLFFSTDRIVKEPGFSVQAKAGQVLVEGLAHCGECHTPRGVLGNLKTSEWLKGAAHPSGKGRIPMLVPSQWSEQEIAEYLKSGFTPDFDTAGGEMAEVVENTGKLTDDDRRAIAAYLKALDR